MGPHVYHVDSDGNVKDSPILKHLEGHWIIETVKYILHKWTVGRYSLDLTIKGDLWVLLNFIFFDKSSLQDYSI